MTRPEHEALPEHIRRGIDDQLARIARDELIGAQALALAGRGEHRSLGRTVLLCSALLTVSLLVVLCMSVFARGDRPGPAVVIVSTSETTGVPRVHR